ncbi:Galectin [Frankliniella occidentalis]|uniref:Galectin n=1 Tax=Frankliniella occidentalis TaxID=133901 RepID=A0A6J1S771_FRAOC|nr:galectin-4-like isoform X1 [Frankliniella occidentalis]KAE8736660.1 Galectin [Frankliniella occidentalis]
MYSNNSFNVPFVRQLEGAMHPGRAIAIYGNIPHHASRFVINLQCGGAPASVSDIALHISVRFDQNCVVRNTQQGGGWQHEERDGGLPLRRGGHFQMLIMCEGHGFKIALNGQHFREFRHRMPFQRVTHVSAEGDVHINSVSGVIGAYGSAHQTHNPARRLHGAKATKVPTPKASTPAYPGTSVTSTSTMSVLSAPFQLGAKNVRSKRVVTPSTPALSVPHVQNIGSVYPGRCLRVRGFIPHNAYRFSVNLATGPSMDYNDLALHVSTRPSEGLVELNTCRRGGWESGQQLRPCPVALGQSFELMILVDDYCYKIAFNGVHFAEWPHRHPYQGVNHVIVEGSVQLQLVSLEGQPRGGGYAPPPPPAQVPFYPSPYGNNDYHHHLPNPYHIIY